MTYTTETAEQMLAKIHKRGWRAYKKGREPSKETPEESKIRHRAYIRGGPAEILDVNTSYVFLPKAKDPADPNCVQKTLDELLQRRGGDMPTITFIYGGHTETWGITGMTLHEDEVKFHTEEGTYVSYQHALMALDTLVETGMK